MKLAFVTAALLALTGTTVSAQEFRFDEDGGRCDYDETGNAWTPYAEIGVEGMYFIDMPRAYSGSGVVLEMKPLKGGIVQLLLQEEPRWEGDTGYHDGKPFWATLDAKKGFFAEGKYKTSAEVKGNNKWYTVGMKPCR